MSRLDVTLAGRYLRSRRSSRLVSLITLIATGGVTTTVDGIIEIIAAPGRGIAIAMTDFAGTIGAIDSVRIKNTPEVFLPVFPSEIHAGSGGTYSTPGFR